MIDVENQIYNGLYDALKAYNSAVGVSSTYCNVPAIYPFVSIEQIDSAPYQASMDDSNIENHVFITFEINIYTKDNTYKKTQAKGLANVVDNYMASKGLIRISSVPFEQDNETAYHLIMRYEGVVSKKEIVFRR